ncbi:GNAT family N-acetyltransferase [Pseudomonas sp. dw_358]|uniref:GNAT family N-acetyltransferase n=1 Tax=Pseudomonas sp. dw_358 TaxID=2720083 RepID=UPI001BD58F8F|nr:GNAT family N-acetyltransferase [Pseudomonas sp. dw_358]
MDHSLHLRQPLPADVTAISLIIERAIRTACAADHRNEQRLIGAWLRSTSPAQLLRCLRLPKTLARLALLQGKPVGVVIAGSDGEILQCYVMPEFSRRGVGTALMTDIEGCLLEQGREVASLSSTLTGFGFYRHLGYRESGQRLEVDGLTVTLMEKSLVRPAMGDWMARLMAGVRAPAT